MIEKLGKSVNIKYLMLMCLGYQQFLCSMDLAAIEKQRRFWRICDAYGVRPLQLCHAMKGGDKTLKQYIGKVCNGLNPTDRKARQHMNFIIGYMRRDQQI